MREGTRADPHIKCPFYTKTGMSLPVLEEFCNWKINENPFGHSMQKYITFVCTCIVLWLFYLVCILYCGCFNLFCNVWVCVCVGFVMCECLCVYVCYVCVYVMSGCVCVGFWHFGVLQFAINTLQIEGTLNTPTFCYNNITKAQLLGSRLKQWNLLEKGVTV